MSGDQILKIISLEHSNDQAAALDEMFGSLSSTLDEATLIDLQEAVVLREETSPTFLENGLAMPHGRISSLNKIVIVVGLKPEGIDWPTDDKKARLVIMVGVPAPMVTGYLKILQIIIRWHKSSKIISSEGSVMPERISDLEQELKTVLA